jgi:hypothetical protein
LNASFPLGKATLSLGLSEERDVAAVAADRRAAHQSVEADSFDGQLARELRALSELKQRIPVFVLVAVAAAAFGAWAHRRTFSYRGGPVK